MAFELPRIPPQIPPDYEGFKLWWAGSFLPWWQQVVEKIESQEARQDQVDTDLQQVVNDLTDAVADIAAAQATATAAESTANTVQRDDAIASSWTSPGTILSAADAGSDATISIVAHTRNYNDGASVSVNGGSVGGAAFSTKHYVYYDDPTRAGGAVSYGATTNPNIALPGAAPGRHLCGVITTPADGGGGTSGGYNPPGGGGGIGDGDIP